MPFHKTSEIVRNELMFAATGAFIGFIIASTLAYSFQIEYPHVDVTASSQRLNDQMLCIFMLLGAFIGGMLGYGRRTQ